MNILSLQTLEPREPLSSILGSSSGSSTSHCCNNHEV